MIKAKPVNSLRIFSGPIGEKIHAYDWSNHPLGAIENWSDCLCQYIQLILFSKVSMMIFWGDQNTIFTNEKTQDYFINKLGLDFPLGKKASEYFKDTWTYWKDRLKNITLKKGIVLEEDSPSILVEYPKKMIRFRTLQASPLVNESGEISGVLILSLESTEKILTIKNLVKDQKRLVEAIDSSQIGTFEYLIKTDEMHVSDQFIKLVGGTKGMTRTEFMNCLLPEYVEIRNKAYEIALKTGILKYQARNHVNPERWLQTEGKIFYDEKGNPFKMSGTVKDISLEKEQALRLLQSNINLERELNNKETIQRQKDEFLQLASHELKTPLTSIRGYALLLEEILIEKRLDVESKMIGKLNSKIDQLNNLVQNFFYVFQINRGKLDFIKELFDLNELVRFVADDFRINQTQRQFREEYLFQGKVIADRDRISHVLNNLLSNAIKYSPPGSDIQIRTRREGDFIAVDIEDKGLGIQADESTRIFESFYRSPHSFDPKYSGLGLGLYISSEIIKRQGGNIQVSSILGKGSKFTFTIPILKNLIIQ